MIKFRLYLDKDEETKWLNEMAEQGYAMTRFFAGFYRFEECEPGKYIYQIDFGTVSEDYREFMTDTGVEIVQCWGYWIILRKKAADGEFVLYTDVDSSIEHYTKILKMFKIVTIIELICLIVEVIGAVKGSALAIAFMFLICAFVGAFLNAIIKTKQTIAALKERKGEQIDGLGYKSGNVSLVLSAGLLLNACALMIQESISSTTKMIIQVLAIILMLIGLYRTVSLRNRT